MPDVSHAGTPIIGIAGGIGAGKSTVAQMLAELGCMVSESDIAARAALRQPHIRDQLVEWWGQTILDAQGEISRSAVASLIFADPVQRRRLESLTHPWVEARRREQFAQAGPDVPALVIDAPLLFEAGLDRQCDAVIFVDAELPIRQSRVRESRGWSEADLARREASQLPLDVKRRRADYIVENNADPSHLRAQVDRVLSHIVEAGRTDASARSGSTGQAMQRPTQRPEPDQRRRDH